MTRRRAPRAALLAAVAGCAVACGAASQAPAASLAQTRSLSGVTVSGAHLDAASLHGHPVLLSFWASWCGPCHDEQARLNAAYQRWARRGVDFIGVDMLDSTGPARAFQHSFHVAYPSIVDGGGTVAAGFLIPAAPALVLLDRQGRVVDTILGGLENLSDHDLDAKLQSLVGRG